MTLCCWRRPSPCAGLGGPIDPVYSLHKAISGLMHPHSLLGSHTLINTSLTLTSPFFPRSRCLHFFLVRRPVSLVRRLQGQHCSLLCRYFCLSSPLSCLCSPIAVFVCRTLPNPPSIFVCRGLSERGRGSY